MAGASSGTPHRHPSYGRRISKVFDTVIVEGVPQLKLSDASELRRLITMVDAFYDSQVRPPRDDPINDS